MMVNIDINKKLLLGSIRNTTGATLYIFIVSLVMRNGDKLFGNMNSNIFAPFAFLLLFALSAAVVGGLVFGQSVYLFLENKKKDAVLTAVYSVGCLFILTVLALSLLILI